VKHHLFPSEGPKPHPIQNQIIIKMGSAGFLSPSGSSLFGALSPCVPRPHWYAALLF
jgi:hypothetical protein